MLLPNDALFSQPQAIDEQRERSRFALRHDFSESSQVVLLASEENLKQTIGNLPTANNYLANARNDRQTVRSDVLEAQYLYQLADWRFVAGVSHVRENQMYNYGAADYGIYGTYPESTNHYLFNATTVYGYGQYRASSNLTLDAGLASDGQTLTGFRQHLVSPKLGLRWQAVPGGTLRLAAMQGVNRFFINGASLEPTEVAGFQQYYNDSLGMRSDRVGLGWDQRFAGGWDWGIELSRRQLRLPTQGGLSPYDHWRERNGRAWLSRTLSSDMLAGVLPGWQGSVVLSYDGQDYVRHEQSTGLEQIRDYRPRHLRLAGHLFDASGWGVDMGVTWVRARGTTESFDGTQTLLHDSFPVADAAVSWKLPHRRGQLSVGVLNLFDRRFQYLEMDPVNPRFAPERYVYARLRLTL